MGKPLRALVVEDVEADAELLLRELRRGGFEVSHERVDTPEAMVAALRGKAWDVVIADYAMPRFSAAQALALTKNEALDLPFIIVSGTVNEEIAVEVMRAGAHDFMAKGNFARLIPAIDREMREVALRAERIKMQEQLLISDRMVSVGTLAAGVAHEINNPLAALIANLDFVCHDIERLVADVHNRARTEAGAGERDGDWLATRLRDIDEPLREAREAADRVRLIVRDLRVFSRADDEHSGPVDVCRVLDSSLRIAWNEVRHRARLVKDYRDVPPVEANEGRLGQVFLNLVINAAQAMPDGRADHNEIRVTVYPFDAGRVAIEVADTGTGIPDAAIGRVFDPFFTTKPIGVGTGLGLSICHQIVTSFGGEIDVETEVGRGTVFRIVLPNAKSDSATPRLAPLAVAPGRRGRILVVDDEPALGFAIRRMLAPSHDVVVLTNGHEAVARIVGGEPFDVILCDLMMPELSGMDLYTELERLGPEHPARMVFMTGGAFTPGARKFLDTVRNPRLEKPFDGSALLALVHSLLR